MNNKRKTPASASCQLGIIPILLREEIRTDLWGTLTTLAKLGFKGIEGDCFLGSTEAETRQNLQRLNNLGLQAIALSCPLQKERELDRIIDTALLVKAGSIVTYWGPAESEDQLKRDAEVYERMAVKCLQAGLSYCYHHHDHELLHRFGRNGSSYALEILLENAPHLQLELDLAWCLVGGVDPVEMLLRHAGRIPLVHLKDVTDTRIRGRFCSVGNGLLNCRESVLTSIAQGAHWIIVEQDSVDRLSPMESVTASILNLRERGLIPNRA